MQKKMYTSPYGFWAVTTEGDVEGRSVNHLGTYEGFIDDIAFALADKCYYSLKFSRQEPLVVTSKTKTKVHIHLDIDSGTWDMDKNTRLEAFQKLFAGRNVTVKPGQFYASVELIDGTDPETILLREKELKRQKALEKLNTEERELLGIK